MVTAGTPINIVTEIRNGFPIKGYYDDNGNFQPLQPTPTPTPTPAPTPAPSTHHPSAISHACACKHNQTIRVTTCKTVHKHSACQCAASMGLPMCEQAHSRAHARPSAATCAPVPSLQRVDRLAEPTLSAGGAELKQLERMRATWLG